MSTNTFVILSLLGLALFVGYQFYRIIAIVRGGNDREQRFNQMMIVEQARIEMLKRKTDEAAQAVPVNTIGKPAPEMELDQRLSA